MGKEEQFLPPRAGRGVLPRARVNVVLDAAKERGGHWVHIGAPGGFGKSLAVSQWLRPQRNKFAWIALDPYDNNENHFVRKFLGGLAFAQRANRKLARAAEQVKPPCLEYLFDALELLLPNEKQYTLILDDLHHLRAGSILQALPLIRKRLASRFMVCLLSREGPLDVFLDAILKGDMTVLNAGDLAFDDGELRWLLSRNGCSPLKAPEFMRRTGGWPIAAGALLAGAGRRQDTPNAAAQAGDPLYRFLDAHVWSGWDREIQDFLMRASLPAILDERLCRRLTGHPDSAGMLRALNRNLALVSHLGDGRYRLHDLFRDFLREKLVEKCGADGLRELEKKLADALFEEEDYYAAAAHYIRCSDPEGLSACCAEFRKIAVSTSVEDRIAFFKEYVIGAPRHFFEGNLPVLAQCAFVHYLDGNARQFLRIMDSIRRNLQDNPDKKQDADTFQLILALQTLDFRKPLSRYEEKFLRERNDLQKILTDGKIRLGTFTAAMPLLHRALREQPPWNRSGASDDPFSRRRKAFSPFLGDEHAVILECHIAGLLYESSRLQEACSAALKAQKMMETIPCRPEVRFSATLILAAILRAMGRKGEAEQIETTLEERIKQERLLPLRPSFRAWRYAVHIAEGDVSAAQEWLEACPTSYPEPLPLYRAHQHFVTERALIAAHEDALAVLFGERLLRMGMAFRRRLDIIEASLLLAIAYRNLGNRKASLRRMKKALKLAALCGFSRLFINDAPALAPILNTLVRNCKTNKAPWVDFAVQVQAASAEISAECGAANTPPPKERESASQPELTGRQLRILELLERNASYGEIAECLGLSHSTAKYHILRLYRTLGVSGAAQALARTGRAKLAPPDPEGWLS